MAKKNPGKVFEEDFKKSVPEDCWIYRFKDGTANFNGQKNENVRFQAKNICDFQVMTSKKLYLLELKSHASVSIGFDCIRENQINEMTKIDHPRIKAYFIFNFRDLEKTFAIEAIKVRVFMETANRKSFPFTWCEENGIEIKGGKKRTRWSYDLNKFFNETEELYV
ncbi:Holliday junction resolvase RecU [Clostridium sp.]|uniref:Holliday junction resolvase RecU n=1 Tax=Clostridium sp. TaxID=1506 RepID=UPI002605421E|nr:Holliday junction resolvase RecU [Clostridium sp.]